MGHACSPGMFQEIWAFKIFKCLCVPISNLWVPLLPKQGLNLAVANFSGFRSQPYTALKCQSSPGPDIYLSFFFSGFSRWEILCMLPRRLSLFAWDRQFITPDLFIIFLQCFHKPQEQPSDCTGLIIRNSYSFQILGTLCLSGHSLPSQFITKGSLTLTPLHSQTRS